MRQSPVVSSFASAFPLAVRQEDLWEGFFAARFPNRRRAQMAFSASGIEARHAAVNPLVEDISQWSTGARMERYRAEALPLAKAALSQAIDAAGVSAADLGLLAVVSCTGYSTPGIDIEAARDLGADPALRRLVVGHVGCHAALPALEAVRDFVVVHDAPAALLCVELPSLHLQPPSGDPEEAVVQALFSDAACALVVAPPDRPGLSVLDVAARSNLAASASIGWLIGDRGFSMSLSPRVPDLLAPEIVPLVDGLLARNGLGREEVGAWAIHPGGRRVIDVVGERLALGPDELAPSREVLRAHGNCSSPTVLLVLEEIARRGLAAGSHLVALAFGPGLSAYAALFEVV